MRVNFSFGKNDYNFTLFDLRVRDRQAEEQAKDAERDYWKGVVTGVLPILATYLTGLLDEKRGVYNPPFSNSHPAPEEFDQEDDDDTESFVDPHSGYVREVRSMSDLIKVANEFNARLQRIEKHLSEDDGDMKTDA